MFPQCLLENYKPVRTESAQRVGDGSPTEGSTQKQWRHPPRQTHGAGERGAIGPDRPRHNVRTALDGIDHRYDMLGTLGEVRLEDDGDVPLRISRSIKGLAK